MRAFLMIYASDVETGDSDDDRRHYGKSKDAECRAYTLLSSVCSNWHLTLTGWPQSTTPLWVKHKLKKLIKCE